MKKVFWLVTPILMLVSLLNACRKESAASTSTPVQKGTVSGRVTDAADNPLAGIKVVLEHTLWSATYVFATTNSDGYYKADLPKDPAGSWTAKAQLEKAAYGINYKFDLHPSGIEPFTVNDKPQRDFTWKLQGAKPSGNQYYGAHVDLYQWAIDVNMTGVRLVFTPLPGETLVDGSPAKIIERAVEDVAGTFMVRDLPIGKYTVKAIYPVKTLLLDNRKDNGDPEQQKTVVFGKNGYLGETEYNIEFWLTE